MNGDILIRPARPTDAEVASALLYSAYTHEQITYPRPEEHSFNFAENLQRFFCEKNNRFSYQYSQIAEHNSAVVGLILSFAGRDEPFLNDATGWHLAREARDDEWYIDALAVLKNWGHRGIGTLLLHSAEQLARQHHYTRVALSVAQENTSALSLYQKQHYTVTQEILLYQQPYLRMVKILADQEKQSS